jgi:flagellar biosynthetic protein FliQ
MTDAEILSIMRQFFWSAALISTPLLLSALLVGMLVGLLQALTSIQEMTLTFVPKLGVMLIVFIATAGFMARICINLFDNVVIPAVIG